MAPALSDRLWLGLDLGYGMRYRLEALFNDQEGIAIKRSRIDELHATEGLRGGKEETC